MHVTASCNINTDLHTTNVDGLKPILAVSTQDPVETSTIVLVLHPYQSVVWLKPIP